MLQPLCQLLHHMHAKFLFNEAFFSGVTPSQLSPQNTQSRLARCSSTANQQCQSTEGTTNTLSPNMENHPLTSEGRDSTPLTTARGRSSHILYQQLSTITITSGYSNASTKLHRLLQTALSRGEEGAGSYVIHGSCTPKVLIQMAYGSVQLFLQGSRS